MSLWSRNVKSKQKYTNVLCLRKMIGTVFNDYCITAALVFALFVLFLILIILLCLYALIILCSYGIPKFEIIFGFDYWVIELGFVGWMEHGSISARHGKTVWGIHEIKKFPKKNNLWQSNGLEKGLCSLIFLIEG